MSSPFMQLYIGDYLRDTQGLATEGHGAYLLIMFAMWNADGWVSADPRKLAQYARMTPAKWARIAPDIMPLLTVENGMATQKRLLRELEKASGKSLVRSAAGKRGAEAKALKTKNVGQANAEAIAIANAQANGEAMVKHSPETRNQKPERKKKETAAAAASPAPIADLLDLPEFLDRRDEAKTPVSAPPPPRSEVVDPPKGSDVQRAFDAYNAAAAAAGWAVAARLDDRRTKALKARLAECGGFAGWAVGRKSAMGRAVASAFLRGRNDRSWKPGGLDWFLKPANFTKLMEGSYDDRPDSAGPQPGGRLERLQRAAELAIAAGDHRQ